MSGHNALPQQAPRSTEQTLGIPTWRRITRTVGSYATMAVAGAALSTGVGTTLAPVETQLGPHNVEATLNLHNEAVLDLGPLGSFVKHNLHDSPVPIGANITVKEIPYSGSSLGINDITSYASFFDSAGREAAVHELIDSFTVRAWKAAGIGFGGGIAMTGLVHWRRRRNDPLAIQAEGFRVVTPRQVVCAGSIAALMCLGGSATIPEAPTPRGDLRLEAIGIHDVEARGALLNTGVDRTIDIAKSMKATEASYVRIRDNIISVYDATLETEKADPNSPFNQYAGKPHKIILVESDMHCNTYQAAQVGRIADHIGADLILDAGDRTISGYSFEKRCIEALARHTKVPRGAVMGNHDSSDVTATQSREAGDTVLNDEIVTLAGIRIIGGPDRNRSLIGQGTHQVGEQSNTQHGEQLAQKACEDPQPQIALVHDPTAAKEIMEAGCVPLVIAGHEHRPRRDTAITEQGISQLVVMGSTGGAPADGEATLTVASKLTKPAHMAVIILGPNNEPLFIRNITVMPNGAVTITTEKLPPQQPQLNPILAASGQKPQ